MLNYASLSEDAIMGDPSASSGSLECFRLAGRKSIPRRSPSISDAQPGIIFKINHSLQQACRIDGRMCSTGSYSGSTIAFGLTSSASGAVALHGGRTTRSKSISIQVKGGDSFMDNPYRRQRSNSLTLAEEDQQIDVLMQGGDYSDGDMPMHPIQVGSRARKASISGESTSGYGGSMSHLVPNRLLMSTSRRISVSSPHDGCVCASCSSQITPYWRDGWSPDVMLCNACGLRYQKFARRCPSCVYIPRKEDSLGDNCIRCNTCWVYGSASS